MAKKLYANRNIEFLDDQGNYFCKHLTAMTAEQLSSKADIAAELAYRDYRIAELEADVALNEDIVIAATMLERVEADYTEWLQSPRSINELTWNDKRIDALQTLLSVVRGKRT